MRRPVRSHNVTDRKLFNNGGFPTMGAQAQMPNPANIQMGGNLPQANNIAAPSGILASSTELSNTVGDQALAQSFAPAIGMNSGGIASFANGGGNNFPGAQAQDYTMDKLNALLEEIGVRGKNVGGRLGDTGSYLRSYVPPLFGGKAYEGPKEGEVIQSTVDVTTYGAPLGVNKDFKWEITDSATNTATLKDFTFADTNNNDITARNWFNEVPFVTADRLFTIRGPEVGLDGVIKNMVDSLPHLENEIVSFSQEIIAKNPNIEKNDLREQVAVAIKTIAEGDHPGIQRIKQEGAANLYQDTQGQTPIDVRTDSEYIEANKTPIDEVMEQIENVGYYKEQPIDPSIVGENEINTDIDLALSQWKARNYSSAFIEELRDQGKTDEFLGELLSRMPPDQAGSEHETNYTRVYDETVGREGEKEIVPADSVRNIKDFGDLTPGEGEEENVMFVDIPIPIPPQVDETDGSRENINILAPDHKQEIKRLNKRNKEIAEEPLTAKNLNEGASNAGDKIFVQQARGDEQESINETLDTFAKEFMDRMPEFKGKTENEKGWDLIMLGSAIMGGTSPNALENIAKGFLATGDRFTEDDKAKRVYDNSIQMGAAKYSLQKLATQEARDARREEQVEWMYAGKDITYNGKTYTQGSAIPVNLFNIMKNGVPDGLIEGSVYSANIATVNTVNTNLAKMTNEAVKNATISETEETNILELQSKLSKSYKSSVTGRLYLNRAVDILNINPTAISGGSSVLKEAWSRFKNAFNVGDQFKDKWGKADDNDVAWGAIDSNGEYLNATRQAFNMNVRIAFQNLIPVALAGVQSANSISNRDVQFLADAFINSGAIDENGLLGDNWWKNTKTIKAQLNATNELFLRNEQGFLTDMQKQFTRLQDRYKPGIATGSRAEPGYKRASSLVPENMPYLYNYDTGEVRKDDDTNKLIPNPNYIGSYQAEAKKQQRGWVKRDDGKWEWM